MITLTLDPFRQLMKKFTNRIVKVPHQSFHNHSLRVLKSTLIENHLLESSFLITKRESQEERNKSQFHK